ncbi:MAG: hypothetical protein KatS3mg057_1673 [Herpetosiphonaceae bacterium]|nr:MAG: hypothetical protein KatS3mg057_1673 [Herpetosiphonaceae bacterium]
MDQANYSLTLAPRALIVEDFHAHALAAAAHLRQVGFSIEIAQSLAEGVARAQALLEGSSAYPLLILIDLHLPIPRAAGLDDDSAAMTEGAALAAYLRPRLHGRTLLVAYTSDPNEESHQEAILAGCRAVLPKPFRPIHAHLLRALVELSTGNTSPVTALAEERPAAAPISTGRPPEKKRGGLLSGFQKMLERAATRIIRYATLSETAQDSTPSHRPSAPEQQRMRWDQNTVRALLLNYPDLLEDYPAAGRWIEEQGGLESVLARIRAGCVRYPKAQQQILDQLIAHPDASDWDLVAYQVGLAKTAYYRHRQKLFRAIATEMNTWH